MVFFKFMLCVCLLSVCLGTDWFSELIVLLKSLILKRLPLHICDTRKEQRHNIERDFFLNFLKTTDGLELISFHLNVTLTFQSSWGL